MVVDGLFYGLRGFDFQHAGLMMLSSESPPLVVMELAPVADVSHGCESVRNGRTESSAGRLSFDRG